MTYDPRRPPPPQITVENPAFNAWVEHRAVDLCVDAEPEDHTNALPCWTHLQAARREGLEAWRKAGSP